MTIFLGICAFVLFLWVVIAIADLKVHIRQAKHYKTPEDLVCGVMPIWHAVPKEFNYFCVDKSGHRMFVHRLPEYHPEYDVFSFTVARVLGKSFIELEGISKCNEPFLVGRVEGVIEPVTVGDDNGKA